MNGDSMIHLIHIENTFFNHRQKDLLSAQIRNLQYKVGTCFQDVCYSILRKTWNLAIYTLQMGEDL